MQRQDNSHIGMQQQLQSTDDLEHTDLNEEDTSRLLMVAAAYGCIKVIETFCLKGVDTEQVNHDTGRTALLTAVACNQNAAIKMLLNHFTDVDHGSIQDGTPLMLAIKNGYVEATQTLLSYSPDLFATPVIPTDQLLNIAKTKNRQLEVQAYLKKQHEGILPMQTQVMTAIHYAVFFGQTPIVAMLLEKMPNISMDMLTNLSELALAMDNMEVYSLLQVQLETTKFLESVFNPSISTPLQRQDKNQESIKQKLFSYIKLQNITTECLNHLSTTGFCFGFSLCRASMRVTGKLAWWEAAMTLIAEWDGQESSLHDEYILPDANDDTPVSLQSIFERCIHYLVLNQATPIQYPHLNYLQSNFLEPDGDFILLRNNDEISKVTRCTTLAGHFEFGDLLCTLNDDNTKEALAQNICLISNYTHTCELSFNDEKNQWSFYDPNYPDGKAKLFSNLTHLISEIRRIMGETLIIRLAELDDKQRKPFSYYYTLLEHFPEKLIQKNGLSIIAMFNNRIIPTLIDNLKKIGRVDHLQLNIVDNLNNTPMQRVLIRQDIKAMEAFASVGANLNEVEPCSGLSLLMQAAKLGLVNEIDFLCLAGANIEQINHMTGETALLAAVADNKAASIKMLLNHFADINKGSGIAGTPLMLAIQLGHTEAAQTLLSYPSNLLAIAPILTDLLLNAANTKNRRQEVINYLTKQHGGMLLNYTQGMTALHCAVFFGRTEMVAMLLEKIPPLSIQMLTSLREISLAMDHPAIDALLQPQHSPSTPLTNRPVRKRKREVAPITDDSFASLPHPSTLMLDTSEITTRVKVSVQSLNDWKALTFAKLPPGVISIRKVRKELCYFITFNPNDGLEIYKDWYRNHEPLSKKSRDEQSTQTSTLFEASILPRFTTLSTSPLSLFTNNSVPAPVAPTFLRLPSAKTR